MPNQYLNVRVERAACVCLTCFGYLLLLAGCSNLPSSPAEWIGSDTPDVVEGVVAPSKTLLELKKLAKQAKSASPDQKRASSKKLTEMIKREDDPAIRAQIVRTLGHYDTLLAGEVLAAALRDGDPAVRVAGCKAWVRRGGKEAVAALSRALAQEKDKRVDVRDVRLAAAEGLGQLGDADAVEALASALGKADASWQRTDPALQYRIVKSLEGITGQSYHNDFGAWQQYARGERPRVKARPVEESLAEKFRRLSPF